MEGVFSKIELHLLARQELGSQQQLLDAVGMIRLGGSHSDQGLNQPFSRPTASNVLELHPKWLIGLSIAIIAMAH